MIKTTLEALDAQIEGAQGKGFRNHLGASIIGRPCARMGWYNFRWAYAAHFTGRMLRLFDRGHEEELRLIKYMRRAGIGVLDKDPTTGKQWRISDHDGHFGGSFDSKLWGVPEFWLTWILGEYKTHNDKSFKKVAKEVKAHGDAKGLAKAKYEHIVQQQIYMHYGELPAALYFAVNKDNDHMMVLTIEYDDQIANKEIAKAKAIIYSREAPPRMKGASPGWWICQWCDYIKVCHEHKPKAMNCRTCRHSRPSVEATWVCELFGDYVLTRQEQLRGCQQYNEIPE